MGSVALSKDESVELAHLEKTIQNGLGVWESVMESLAIIKEKGLYKYAGTFQDYFAARWEPHLKKAWRHKFSRIHIYRLVKAVDVAANLSTLPIGNKGLTESQARVLGKADPETQRKTWSTAKESEASGGPKATANRLQQILDGATGQALVPVNRPDVLADLEQTFVTFRKQILDRFGPRAHVALGKLDDVWDDLTALAEEAA